MLGDLACFISTSHWCIIMTNRALFLLCSLPSGMPTLMSRMLRARGVETTALPAFSHKRRSHTPTSLQTIGCSRYPVFRHRGVNVVEVRAIGDVSGGREAAALAKFPFPSGQPPLFLRGSVVAGFQRGSKQMGVPTGEWSSCIRSDCKPAFIAGKMLIRPPSRLICLFDAQLTFLRNISQQN